MVIIKRNKANKYRNKTYQVLLWLFEGSVLKSV